MWIHVTEESDDGSFAGELLNIPLFVEGLGHGDLIEGFRREHIYEARIDRALAER